MYMSGYVDVIVRFICVDLDNLLLFVKVNTRNANHARATTPISTVNSCSWDNHKFME